MPEHSTPPPPAYTQNEPGQPPSQAQGTQAQGTQAQGTQAPPTQTHGPQPPPSSPSAGYQPKPSQPYAQPYSQQPYPEQPYAYPAGPPRYGGQPYPPQQTPYRSPSPVIHVYRYENDIMGREFIPVMHPCTAVTLCIINFILPGFGTMIAGCLALCGAANPGSGTDSAATTFCCNLWIGFLQLLTVPFFLLGWIWSIFWGFLFIAQSAAWDNPYYGTTTVTTYS
eukprot:m.39879 g.39879  ORF g.39879 m.39879 type:complete len:224 (+) comp11664_c0_seq1:408-1079(+)